MFTFPCALCGQIEMVHLGRKTIEKHLRAGIWYADWMYREEPMFETDADDVTSKLNDLFSYRKGYRHSPDNCPGFMYRKHDQNALIDTFCNSAPNYIECLPKSWEQMAQKRIDLEEIRELEGPLEPWYPSSTVVIFSYPETGYSQLVQIE